MFTRVCKRMYQAISERETPWVHLIKTAYKKELAKSPETLETIKQKKYTFEFLFNFIKSCEKERALQGGKSFLENYNKLFVPGHMKENVSSKMIKNLEIRADIIINKNRPYYCRSIDNHPIKMKNENNFTHILMNIPRIKEVKFDVSLDQLEIDIIFRSNQLKRKLIFNYILTKKELYTLKRSTKAFHYFPVRNFLFVYFDDDNKVLYMLYEISAIELIRGFEFSLKKSIKVKGPKKFAPSSYQDLEEKIKEQLDYEAHLTIQNHQKTLFTYVGTKLFPRDFSKKKALFIIPIEERYSMKNNSFKLDDGQGINEIINDFVITDVVLKDVDHILVLHSGFAMLEELEKSKYGTYLEDTFKYNEEYLRVLLLKHCEKTQNITIILIEDSRDKSMLVYSMWIEITDEILKYIY